MTLADRRREEILTAALQTLQTLSALPGDIRGPSAPLELRLGALETTATLVIGVLTTLTAGGRWGTLHDTELHFYNRYHSQLLP